MMPEYIYLHLIQAHHPHGILQQGVVPYPVGLSRQLLLRDNSLQPVVEAPYYPIYVGSYHPGLHTKYQDILYDGWV